ncbi:MAG TPA: aromatic amino acid ammonia-lyase, partial [Bacteroidales bacterium]|nr:aromatic amino acid ammonia-lyase [Bacteroidales bacterium]
GGEKVELDTNALEEVAKSYAFLESFAQDKIIYGINTGLGPMAQYKVDKSDQVKLQYNLIRSHASGSGKNIPNRAVRALMVARLNNFMQGYSGIHPDIPLLLKDFINDNIIPVIPEHGGVGASGDLVQLAHLALCLIGEGDMFYKNFTRQGPDVFAEAGLTPAIVHIREGLALVNGTSCMSGIGILSVIKASKLLDWSLMASAMINEVVETYDDHYSYELNRVKLHPGQNDITDRLQNILKGSQLVRKRADHLYNGNDNEEKVFTRKIQEYYSLRCITQILGPVSDTINNAEKVLLNEINSVNDNPVIDYREGTVNHGGNFHGDYVSLEMDKLKIAITKLSMLAERQINFLMNEKLNNSLPPFVNLGILGLNLGMQGVQFTATSTVAENQALSNPMYIHSIPTNNDNQDIVSMGTNAALMAMKVIDNTFEVLAIELIALLQAIDSLDFADRLSPATHAVYSTLRKIVPAFKEDSPKFNEIRRIRKFIQANGTDLGQKNIT